MLSDKVAVGSGDEVEDHWERRERERCTVANDGWRVVSDGPARSPSMAFSHPMLSDRRGEIVFLCSVVVVSLV